ncbi:MAG TPA: polymer-forming cytoskeletal protein [Prosthecochloris aestuarii]|uniref:Polymer-forming cytoskeletal protein n=1 Tax=Prosthecochloris aestuarii TaxID=1102 RepID=A0A831WV42_PROAE|nr:polymer-forming cytoskeletal protein [Prosthecochloris aestuarii]
MAAIVASLLALLLLFPSSGPGFHHGPDEQDDMNTWRTGSNVTIRADETVDEPLFVAALSVIVDGIIRKQSVLRGVYVEVNGILDAPAVITAASTKLEGTFQDSLTCYAANVVLSGTFNGDLVINAAHLSINPGARINGDLQYSAASLSGLEHAQIKGSVTQVQVEAPEQEIRQLLGKFRHSAAIGFLLWWVTSLAGLIVTGMIIHRFFPQFTLGVTETMQTEAWSSVGAGFAVLVATPVIAALLALSLVGLPLAFIAMSAYGMALYTSQVFGGIWLGRTIARQFRKTGNSPAEIPASLLTGALLIWIIRLVPVFGWLFTLLVLMLGFGAITRYLLASIRQAPAADD